MSVASDDRRVVATTPGGADWMLGGSRHDQSRERMLRAAEHLVAEQGADGFGAGAVAERAGCSRATLYRVMGGKSCIMRAVVKRRLRCMSTRMDRTPGTLASYMEAILAAVRADPVVMGFLMKSSGEQLRAAAQFREVALEAIESELRVDSQRARQVLGAIYTLVVWPMPSRDAEYECFEYVCAQLTMTTQVEHAQVRTDHSTP